MRNEEYHYIGSISQDKPFFIHIAGITYPDPKYLIRRENARMTNIEYIISGSGTLRCESGEFHPRSGQVYILQRGSSHEYFSDPGDPWTKIWLNVCGSVVDSLTSAYRLDDRVVFDGAGTLGCFERMIGLCREKLPPDETDTKAAPIFHELLQRLWLNGREASLGISPEVRKLRDHIDSHLHEKLTIDELAGLIYKSKSQTLRIFRDELGTTPYEYLLTARINQAKTLLSSTNMPIKEVACRSGFSDEHYFSYTFKRRCGETPSGYRANGLGNT